MNAHTPRRPRCLSGARATAIAVASLLTVHAGLLGYSATRHSPTLNEPGHLVAGLMQWEFGRFEVYKVNPPLVHYLAALPVVIAGYEPDWTGFTETPTVRPEFTMGEDFIRANGERSIWLFTLARWACIPISLIGGLFCYLWSRELWNSTLAGLVSLTLWCFEPNILAHGELITSDCAAASFGLGAGYCYWRWLRRPNWSRTVAAGLLLGLALLSKTLWVILIALWPLLWLFWLVSGTRCAAASRSQELIKLAAILILGLYILNAGYAFDGAFTRLKDFTFLSTALTGEQRSRTPGNRFTGTVLADVPVPLPRQFVLGIDLQKCDFEQYGSASYLRGEWQNRGWWYYYLYGLAVKTPHGTQLLLFFAVFLTIRHWWKQRERSKSEPGGRGSRRAEKESTIDLSSGSAGASPSQDATSWRDLVILLAPAAVLMVLVSSQMEFNHHVRYVLPVLGFLFVFIGCVLAPRTKIAANQH